MVGVGTEKCASASIRSLVQVFSYIFRKFPNEADMAETDENLISLAAGEREEEDGLMCCREEYPPEGMFTGSHLPYFYLSCWMPSFIKLPRFSFTSTGASECSNSRKSVCIWGA